MDRKIEKKKWPPKRIIKYSAIGLFILVVGYLLIFKAGGSTLNIKRERTTISEVKSGPFQEFIPIIGNVLPHKTHFLDPAIGGRVEIIYLRAGAQVKEGDKILKLSNTNLLMTLLNNEAQVNRASNDLRATRLQLERNRLDLKRRRAEADYFLKRIETKYQRNTVLFKENYISKQEFEDFKDEYEYQKKNRALTMESQEQDLKFSEVQVKQLEASVKRMDDNLKLLKEQLENLSIKAPISGQLTSMVAEVGQSIAQGERLGQIDDVAGFKVRAQIDEHYINRVETGRVGEFDFAGNTYQLEVKTVFPEVLEGRFEVDLQFSGGEAKGIRRGMSVHIRLQLSELSQAILLARGGFYQTTGGNWVYVLDESGDFAVKRKIRLGRQNPQFFEVLEGLKPGEKAITSSYENYGDMERLVLQ
ncbi:MAG: HlyD family efflux transporter periplasmic adaptor subunit [bacterium]|nr:HlyD family efflux transporter periplasmic adaptor subunit [bacterium]